MNLRLTYDVNTNIKWDVQATALVSYLKSKQSWQKYQEQLSDKLSSVSNMLAYNCIIKDEFKYKKSAWWMPWRQETMKDVVGCEKLRGGVNNL